MTTAEETRALLLRYVAAWQAGDVATMLDSYSDDTVFHYFGTTDIAGDHVGKDASVAAMLTASTRAPRELVDVVDVLVGEHLGTLVVRERLTRGDRVVELRRVFVYRVEAGRFAECWVHDEDQRLVDELWAPES